MKRVQHIITTWDCAYCGTEDIFALDPKTEQKINNCYKCGGPIPVPIEGRGVEGNPYKIPPKSQWHILETDCAKRIAEDDGEDWGCKVCDRGGNSSQWKHCAGCGASRDGQVFQGHVQFGGDNDVQQQVWAKQTVIKRNKRQEQKLSKFAIQKYSHDNSGTDSRSHSGKWTLYVLGLVAFVVFLAAIFYTKNVDGVVTGFRWERSVAIEQFQQQSGGDWEDDIPSDAYDINSYKKHHHYKNVPDGTKEVEVEKSERYQSGTRKSCDVVNNGNGTATETCRDVPVYDTRYWTETETHTKYKQVSVEETWVDYKIDRWRYHHTLSSSGKDKDPYWPQTTIFRSVSLPQLGDMKQGSRSQSYYVSIQELGGKSRAWKKQVSKSQWDDLSIKDSIVISVGIAGDVKSIASKNNNE